MLSNALYCGASASLHRFLLVSLVLANFVLLSACGGDSSQDRSVVPSNASDFIVTVAKMENPRFGAFSFIDQSGVHLDVVVESNEVGVFGISDGTAISVSGGAYAINGGPYLEITSLVSNGDKVTLRQTSSEISSSTTTVVLTIGEINAAFNVTTLSEQLEQLTTDNTSGREEQGWKGEILWFGKATHIERDLFLYDSFLGKEAKQLINKEQWGFNPKISNDLVVWFDGATGRFDLNRREIFLYDIAAEKTTQLTNNALHDGWLQTHNNQMVWARMDDRFGKDGLFYKSYAPNSSEVIFYDNAIGETTQLTDNELHDEYPQIHNGQVVWVRKLAQVRTDEEITDAHNGRIFFYDSTTGETRQLTDNKQDDAQPQIHNGQVVWRRGSGSDAEIFFYDSVTKETKQLSSDSVYNNYPLIHNSQVVWRGDPHSRGNAAIHLSPDYMENFLYDSESGVTRQLTNNRYNEELPNIRDGQVVWRAQDRLFLYESATGKTTRLLYHNNQHRLVGNPEIHDGQMAWGGWDGTSYEIFLYDIPKSVQP
jgi:hypothetical protein